MLKAKLIAIAPQLVVADVTASAAWYRDTLGFHIINIVGQPPVYAMVERDGMQLHFAVSDTGAIHSNKSIRSICSDLIIWVPEIDLFFEEVTAQGATIIQPIVVRPYGREFVIEDCDGHRILVCD